MKGERRGGGWLVNAGAFALVAACAGSQVPTATAADARRAAVDHPGTTVADLERGRTLYLSHCSSCHQPVPPGSVPAREWPGHLSEMKERARLDEKEADLVTVYLVTMAGTGR